MTQIDARGAATAPQQGSPQPGTTQGQSGNEAKLRRAAEDFTAVALNEMLKPIFDTSDTSDGLFGGGAGERAFRPMMVSEMAKQMAHGGGLGLAEPVYQQMLKLQEAHQDAQDAPAARPSR